MSASQNGWVRWLRFNAVGALGICIQLAVLAFLRSGLGMNYLLATALAVEATVLHNFFLARKIHLVRPEDSP
jgi:putative flippase GtrA